MGFHDALDDGQAETGARDESCLIVFHTIEALEDPLLILFSNPKPVSWMLIRT